MLLGFEPEAQVVAVCDHGHHAAGWILCNYDYMEQDPSKNKNNNNNRKEQKGKPKAFREHRKRILSFIWLFEEVSLLKS